MNQQQYDNLHLAISTATDPGDCHYRTCVIGKLMSIEGHMDDHEGVPGVGFLITHAGVSELKDYPLELLQDLQDAWDCRWPPDTEELRNECFIMLREYHEPTTV